MSENEVELLEIDRVAVQKRKELTTCFAGLFLAHSRKLKNFFPVSDRGIKFGCGPEDLSVFLYVFEVLFRLKAGLSLSSCKARQEPGDVRTSSPMRPRTPNISFELHQISVMAAHIIQIVKFNEPLGSLAGPSRVCEGKRFVGYKEWLHVRVSAK